MLDMETARTARTAAVASQIRWGEGDIGSEPVIWTRDWFLRPREVHRVEKIEAVWFDSAMEPMVDEVGL